MVGNDNIVCGVEVALNDPDDFLKIKETLTRIGISSNKTKTLYQSCHILHKRGKYYIVHFKEMFLLDGKISDISNEDIFRRDAIVALLSDWKLLTVVGDFVHPPLSILKSIKVLPYHDKQDWHLVAKYTIGTKGR
jgi:hypothetical protein